MKKYYSKGNTVTRVIAVNEEKKSYVYYEEANSKALDEKLSEAGFEKTTMKYVRRQAMNNWAKEYQALSTWKLGAIEFLELVISHQKGEK